MKKGPEILTGDQVQDLTDTATKFYLEPFIPEEGIVFLFGKYGTYKTPVTLNMAKAVASGRSLWGLEVLQASPVLYIEADTPRKVILERVQAIGLRGVDIDVAFLYPSVNIVYPHTSSWDQACVNMLREAHQKRKYKVVFFDSLRVIHTLDDKLSETPNIVYSKAASLFPDATIVFVHHERKTRADDLPGVDDEKFSGAQAWVNHATVGARIHYKDSHLNQLTITHTKSQASEKHPPIHLQVMEDGANLEPLSAATLGAVAPIIHGCRRDGMGKAQIDRVIATALGISKSTARRRRLEVEEAEARGEVLA